MKHESLITVANLTKSFLVGSREVPILKGLNFEVGKGEFVIIFGPSGCGKSTLLHCLLGLEPPSGGTITVEGRNFYGGSEDERALYRRHHVGVIYQQPLWIKSFNVEENLAFPLALMGKDENEISGIVHEKLKKVGMDQWATHIPAELSSGEQQKISLARVLMVDPTWIVADEPTGNLDTVSGSELLNTFIHLVAEGKTIIMVTHDLEYLKYGTRLLHMIDGTIVEMSQQSLDIGKMAQVGTKDTEGFGGSTVRDPQFLKKVHL